MCQNLSAQISLSQMRDLLILLTIWHSSHFLTLHFSTFLPAIFRISWAVYRRKTNCKETYYKMNSVQILIYWRNTESYVHYSSRKTSLQHFHGNKNTMVFMSMETWLQQLQRCCSLSDELTFDFWTVQCWPCKSGAFVLRRSGFQFLIGRTTARVVLRASIHMTVIYSLRLLRCLLRSTILVFRIFIALVLFRFASFSPVVLNGEISQDRRHHSVQIVQTQNTISKLSALSGCDNPGYSFLLKVFLCMGCFGICPVLAQGTCMCCPRNLLRTVGSVRQWQKNRTKTSTHIIYFKYGCEWSHLCWKWPSTDPK